MVGDEMRVGELRLIEGSHHQPSPWIFGSDVLQWTQTDDLQHDTGTTQRLTHMTDDIEIIQIMRKADINEATILMNELKDLLAYALTTNDDTMSEYYMQKISQLRNQIDNSDKLDIDSVDTCFGEEVPF